MDLREAVPVAALAEPGALSRCNGLLVCSLKAPKEGNRNVRLEQFQFQNPRRGRGLGWSLVLGAARCSFREEVLNVARSPGPELRPGRAGPAGL